MKKMSKHGFSLMEALIVLLIVAIVAAASAPMISKKMLHSAADNSSPWEWLNKQHAVFNPKGETGTAALIGTTGIPNGYVPALIINSKGDIKSKPQLDLGHNNTWLHIASGNDGSVTISNNFAGRNGTVVGYNSKATGQNSSAFGNDAQASNTNATAIGYKNTASGNGSTAVGYQNTASESQSSAYGYNNNASGSYSLAVGYKNQVQGSNSSAVGYNNQVYGNNSTVIGTNSSANGSYSTAIGNNARASLNNEIVLGDENTTVRIPGKLKIEDLEVNKNLQVNKNFYVVGNCLVGNRLFVYNGGMIGINKNTNKESYAFIKTSSGYLSSFDITGARDLISERDYYITSSGFTTFVSSYFTNSDRRLKNVGKVFQAGLEEIKKLEVFNYTFKDDKDKTPRVGVMAQDLQKIFPNAVTKGQDGYLRIRMEDMFYAIVNAVKQLDAKIEALKNNEILALTKRVTELEKQNADLEKRIAILEEKIK